MDIDAILSEIEEPAIAAMCRRVSPCSNCRLYHICRRVIVAIACIMR